MRKIVYMFIGLIAVAGAGIVYLQTQMGHLAYLPLPVLTDKDWVKTDMYLQVSHEQLDLPMDKFLQSEDEINAPLVRLFNTLATGNVREVRELLHPGVFESQQARNITNFIQGLIENYAAMEDLTITRRFTVGEETVFILTGTLGTIRASSPMRFTSLNSETPRYVPFGVRSPSVSLIEAWSRGRMREWENFPVIVFPQSLSKYYGLAYRVPLATRGEPAALAFNGGAPAKDSDVTTLFQRLSSEAVRRDWSAIKSLYTSGSREYLERAFPDRTQDNYVGFLSGLSVIEPFFYIDGGELAVVFSSIAGQDGHTLNYTVYRDGELKITNAGIIPLSYHVFNDESMMKGLRMKPPFNAMKVN